MTFPHRLKLALFFICCMQHVYASNSLVTASKSSMSVVADSSMMTQADSSTTVVATTSAMSSGYDIASTGGANTTGTPMAATTNVSYTSKASATTIVPPTSTTHDTTTSPSTYVNNTSAHVLTPSSMSTAPNGKRHFLFLETTEDRVEIRKVRIWVSRGKSLKNNSFNFQFFLSFLTFSISHDFIFLFFLSLCEIVSVSNFFTVS